MAVLSPSSDFLQQTKVVIFKKWVVGFCIFKHLAIDGKTLLIDIFPAKSRQNLGIAFIFYTFCQHTANGFIVTPAIPFMQSPERIPVKRIIAQMYRLLLARCLRYRDFYDRSTFHIYYLNIVIANQV